MPILLAEMGRKWILAAIPGLWCEMTSRKSQSGHLPLGHNRTLTIDVLHFHRQMPFCSHAKIFDLVALAELRSRLPGRIAWPLLFLKAFGYVAERYPELRQSFLPRPWPHIYQHHESVAMLAIHREYKHQPWLFWGKFSKPESTPLTELQQRLDRYQQGDVDKVFRQQLQMSRLPKFFRRRIWSWNLHWDGNGRARRAGTCFLSTLASQGVEIQATPSFQSYNLTYGPLDDSGCCRVSIAYDHRLVDGHLIANVLNDWEAAMHGAIARELETICQSTTIRVA